MSKCNNCPTGQTPYIIRKGDTIWALSRTYATTVRDILNVNPGLDPENLQIGQRICLPFVPVNYPACPTGNYYVVGKGQTFLKIAAYFGVSYDLLYKNNMGIDPDVLFEGQVLCIPVAPSPVRIRIRDGVLTVTHKNGDVTDCAVKGSFTGSACVINKQLDIGTSGARILDLSDGGAISGEASRYGGIVVGNEDMDNLFNLVPVGTEVTG